MKAISLMSTLVVCAEDQTLYHEIEVVYENGAIRSIRLPARTSVRVDLDTLYNESLSLPPPPAE